MVGLSQLTTGTSSLVSINYTGDIQMFSFWYTWVHVSIALFLWEPKLWKGMWDKISLNNFSNCILCCPHLHVAFCQMVLCNLLSAIMPSALFSFAWCQMLALLGNYIHVDAFCTISICKLQLVKRHSAISNLVVCFMSNCILLSLNYH